MPKNVLAKSIKKTPTTKRQLTNSVKRKQEEKMATGKFREPDLSKYGVAKPKEVGVSVPAKMKTTTVKTVKTPEAKTVTMTKRSVATKPTKKSGKPKK